MGFWAVCRSGARFVVVPRLALTSLLACAAALPVALPAVGAPTSAAPPAARRYVVAAIGDSLTDPRAGGAKYLRELARRCPESRFDAYGIGGQRTEHMRWRFAQDVLSRGTQWRPRPSYTHVIVLGGVNDLASLSLSGSRIQRIQANLGHMYAAAKARGVAVVALTVPPWGKLRGVNDRRVEATERLNSWILEQEHSGEVSRAIDLGPLLSCGDPQVLCPSYRRFPTDWIHWGATGHEVVAAALHREVFSDCK